MTDELDETLRDALRKRSAPAGFADRVLARLPTYLAKFDSESAPTILQPRRVRQRPSVSSGLQKSWWISGALAASLAAAVALHQIHGRATEREGLRARTELMEALRVTSQKLDLAYQAVQEPSKVSPPEGSS